MSLIIPLERTLPLQDIIKIKFHELAVFHVHERLDIDIQLISGDFMNGRARLIVITPVCKFIWQCTILINSVFTVLFKLRED